MEIKCKVCGFIATHTKEQYCIRKMITHLRKEHSLTKEEYLVKYELDGVHPKCACGCGCNVNADKGWNKWLKYFADHKNTVHPSNETIDKIRRKAKYRLDNGYYDKFIDQKIVNDSFNEFITHKLSLNDITKKYGHDKRTLKRIWLNQNKITEKEYLEIAYKNQNLITTTKKKTRALEEIEFYNCVYDFIMENKYKYNINEINNMFGKTMTQTTLLKNLKNIFGIDFMKYLVLGVKSKEEMFFLDILRFYIGGHNIKYGFKLENKIYDAILYDKILFEYDGSYYHSDILSQNKDKEKDRIAHKYNYVLVRANEKSIKDINFLKKIIEWKNIV